MRKHLGGSKPLDSGIHEMTCNLTRCEILPQLSLTVSFAVVIQTEKRTITGSDHDQPARQAAFRPRYTSATGRRWDFPTCRLLHAAA
jgi:hypothetical protein